MTTLADPDDLFGGSTLTHYDLIDSLLSEYQVTRDRCEKLAALMTEEMKGVVHYFKRGNSTENNSGSGVAHIFQLPGAVSALDAEFWSRAIQLTDVLDVMPQARRDAWHKSIADLSCPPFEEQVVRDTLETLLAQRTQYLAERVDGIFRGLSGEHVTNQPQGFGKRMIIAGVLHCGDCTDHSKAGLVNDLRCVVAKLMRRDELKYNASSRLIPTLKNNWGQWVEIDGGALRIRLYRKGTAHLEIHPDMSWRLNGILATLYPRAIPPEFRERPRRQPKGAQLIQRPLPFAVIELLADMESVYTYERDEDGDIIQGSRRYIQNAVQFRYRTAGEVSRHLKEEAESILESIGGVRIPQGWQFDYPPQQTIETIVTLGCVPDAKAHQFYPTPAAVADDAVARANIQPTDRCLEPQAGLGGLADRMPKERTTCVEVAPLRCGVLTAKGYRVECADFLAWADEQRIAGRTFDKIAMNPPFDQGRWRAHLEAAAGLLAPGGRLVSVLPAGAKSKEDLLPGLSVSFPSSYDNAFPGVSQPVVLLVADRPR